MGKLWGYDIAKFMGRKKQNSGVWGENLRERVPPGRPAEGKTLLYNWRNVLKCNVNELYVCTCTKVRESYEHTDIGL